MKTISTLLIIFSFLQFNLGYAQTATKGPSLKDCEKFKFSNLGFYNSTDTVQYVVLSGSEVYNPQAFFTIEPKETIWQKELSAPGNYFHYVFTSDPGRDLIKISQKSTYMYKGNVSLNLCENKVFTIEY
jgi:hypothetical protein